jgi:hypothetical protein
LSPFADQEWEQEVKRSWCKSCSSEVSGITLIKHETGKGTLASSTFCSEDNNWEGHSDLKLTLSQGLAACCHFIGFVSGFFISISNSSVMSAFCNVAFEGHCSCL